MVNTANCTVFQFGRLFLLTCPHLDISVRTAIKKKKVMRIHFIPAATLRSDRQPRQFLMIQLFQTSYKIVKFKV